MAGKIKKFLKKAGKIALPVGAAFLAAKGLKGLGKRGKKVFPETENINIGVGGPQIPDAPFIKRKRKWDLGGVDPGPTLAAKGGRIGAKHGGKVKSMGVAKRGGGVAKR